MTAPIALGVVTALASCGESATAPTEELTAVTVEGGLLLDLSTARDSLIPFDTLVIDATLSNVTDTPVTVAFESGCPLFAEVVDAQGTAVTLRPVCSDHPMTLTLGQGMVYRERLLWTAENPLAEAPVPVGLPAGRYRAFAVLRDGAEVRAGPREIVVYYPPD